MKLGYESPIRLKRDAVGGTFRLGPLRGMWSLDKTVWIRLGRGRTLRFKATK